VPRVSGQYQRAASLSSPVLHAALQPTARAQQAADRLQALAVRTDALGRGVAGLLHCWQAGHRFAAQPVAGGLLHIESCPAYVATVDGVSRWAARIGWAAAREVLGWLEVPALQARAAGAQLRKLARGVRRGGRHLLLHPWQVEALQLAVGAAVRPLVRDQPAALVLPLPSSVQRLQGSTGPRTVAICCPAHHDTDPSLVLWANGGAQCMSCGWRAAWRARADRLLLYPSQGAGVLCQNTAAQQITTTKHPTIRTQQPAGTLGGYVATRSTAAQHAGSTLAAWQQAGGSWATARSTGHRLAGSPLEALAQAEARAAGPAATAHAQDAAAYGAGLPSRALLPDRLISVSCVRRAGAGWRAPWQPVLQRWMLVDLDDVEGLDSCGPQLGAELAQVAQADSEVGAAVAVVRTGPTGLQVWLQLAQPRHSPAAWCAQPVVRSWHERLGARLLAVAHKLGATGGHSDPSACAAGRWARRPGWRIVDGKAFRATLVHTAIASDHLP
jgi:hypothetical protein